MSCSLGCGNTEETHKPLPSQLTPHPHSAHMEPTVIYKDRHILVLDKPAGMPSTETAGGNPNSLARWIIENFPKVRKLHVMPKEGGLINRLDNETSGLTVAALSDKDYEKLRGGWRGKDVLKEYLCLVVGKLPPSGKITKLIAHHPDKSNKMIVVDSAEQAKLLKAKFAETSFEMIDGFLDYTLVRVIIKGGMRHQIRCHMASIGHPVAGDKLYQKMKHGARDWLGLKRHFLHSAKIGFVHPSSGKYVEFESPLPRDLEDALAKLRK